MHNARCLSWPPQGPWPWPKRSSTEGIRSPRHATGAGMGGTWLGWIHPSNPPPPQNVYAEHDNTTLHCTTLLLEYLFHDERGSACAVSPIHPASSSCFTSQSSTQGRRRSQEETLEGQECEFAHCFSMLKVPTRAGRSSGPLRIRSRSAGHG